MLSCWIQPCRTWTRPRALQPHRRVQNHPSSSRLRTLRRPVLMIATSSCATEWNFLIGSDTSRNRCLSSCSVSSALYGSHPRCFLPSNRYLFVIYYFLFIYLFICLFIYSSPQLLRRRCSLHVRRPEYRGSHMFAFGCCGFIVTITPFTCCSLMGHVH